MEYDKLLEKAYEKVKVVSSGSERFEIPKAAGQIEGKNTIITNIQEIASYLRRPLDQLVKFLQKNLAAAGKVSNGRLILNRKVNSNQVNEKVQEYTQEFVICPVCGKPDTEVIAEKGLKSKHCLACGAKSPIKHNI